MNLLKYIKQNAFEVKKWIKLIYIYPAMNLQKIDYDKYWADKRGVAAGELSDWQKIRAETVGAAIKKGQTTSGLGSVLDIGGGEGNILNYIKNTMNVPLGDMYNADVSDFILQASEKVGIKSIKCDITDMKSFELFPVTDYALMLEILEHIPNSEEFLLEIHKKVQKGVFFSIPNTGFITYRLRLLFGKTPMQWRLHPAEHLRFWTITDIKYWLTGLGFTDRYTIYSYKGVPFLNQMWPNLFAAGMVVEIKK